MLLYSYDNLVVIYGTLFIAKRGWNCLIRRVLCCETTGGAFYSHLENNDLELNRVDFVNNTATTEGGAIYIGEDHASVLLSYVSVSGSWADSGGGLFFGPLSTAILMSLCNVELNSANRGGGVVSSATELTILASVIDSNVAFDCCGGILVENTVALLVAESSISRNSARSSSGGLSISKSVNITVKFCDFVENKVSAGRGGALTLSESQEIIVRTNSFVQNSGDSGGGMHVAASTQVVVNGSVFTENIAQVGSGSAIYVRASALSMFQNDFSGNEAPGGGGTVFWTHASGMQEPVGLQSENVFNASNTAGYGPRWATEAHHTKLLGDKEVYIIEDYTAYAPPVGVTLRDIYGQLVATDSSSEATVSVPPTEGTSCDDEPGFVSGSTTSSVTNGTAVFAALEPLCAPNHSFVLAVSAQSATVFNDTAFEFDFRVCSRGEYYGERICNPCENGSYSFTDPGDVALSEMTKSAVCVPCPSGASRCYKDVIVLKPGHWRSDSDSTNIVECPWDVESCPGGDSSGDSSCGAGYHGPLCAICEDNHHFVSSSRTCEQCNDTSSFFDPFTITLLALVCLCLALAVYGAKQIVE